MTKRGLLHLGIKRGRPGDPLKQQGLTHNETFVCGLPKATLKTQISLYFSLIVGPFFNY